MQNTTFDAMQKIIADQLAKVSQPVKPAISTLTSADLIGVPDTQAFIMPQKSVLTLVNYSDKAFALVGDTKPVKEQIKALGGSFNSRLTCGPGWIFSKKHLSTVKKHFSI